MKIWTFIAITISSFILGFTVGGRYTLWEYRYNFAIAELVEIDAQFYRASTAFLLGKISFDSLTTVKDNVELEFDQIESKYGRRSDE